MNPSPACLLSYLLAWGVGEQPFGPEAYPTLRVSVRLIGPFRRTSLSLSLPADSTDAAWRFMAGVKWSSLSPRIQVTNTVTLLMTLLITADEPPSKP